MNGKAALAVGLAALALMFDPRSLLSEIRTASDTAAASVPRKLPTEWTEWNAAGEPYLIRCTGAPSRLVLYLHTWSTDHASARSIQALTQIENACVISPNFNGPNTRPEALASDDAMRRIEIAVSEARYKTGLQRVYLLAASGGTIPAVRFMARNPSLVYRASLWVPIYDLATLYDDTSNDELRRDMVAVFGAPPAANDAAYVARSPSSVASQVRGPTTVFVNVGANDTQTPPYHGVQLASALSSGELVTAHLKSWSMGHEFYPFEGIRQLVLE